MPRRPFRRIVLTGLAFAIPVALLILGVRYWYQTYQRARQFEPEIMLAAARYKIDPYLVKAVIWRESRFDPNAKGRSGEIGLMQVREDAAFEWADAEHITNFSHVQIWNSSRNIHAGAWYLAKLLKRYPNTDNPLPYALADYNAGRTHVLRWKKGDAATNSAAFLAQMDYPGTREYAISIMDRYQSYRAHAPKPPASR